MPRDLQASERNKATFIDGVSQSEVGLYFRTPTNAERIAFQAATIGRENGKFKDQSAETQLAFGAKILTGIVDGDFVDAGKPISSDEHSKDYDPEWKKLVMTTAGDLVQALALLAFSGVLLKPEGKQNNDADKSGPDMSEVPGLDDETAEPAAEPGEAKGIEEGSTDSPLE